MYASETVDEARVVGDRLGHLGRGQQPFELLGRVEHHERECVWGIRGRVRSGIDREDLVPAQVGQSPRDRQVDVAIVLEKLLVGQFGLR